MLCLDRQAIELGSYRGRSTCCIAAVASSVLSIDSHTGDRHTGPQDTYGDLLANLEGCGVAEKVRAVKVRIERADAYVVPGAFDVAYVDCEHTYESTLAGLALAIQAVKPGGVVAWHDADMNDVRRAATDCGLSTLGTIDRLAWGFRPS
jgi:predicted O-methyltransferase YrrM